MKDYANSRLKLKRTVIWAFCLHKFGWYLKVKVGFLKAKTLFTEGKGFFAFFSDQAMFDLWSLVDHRRGDSTPHSSRQRKRSRNHRLFFNNARTPNSFFIDCFSLETHSLWKRHHVFKFKIVLVKKLEGKFSGSPLTWTKLKLYKCWNKKKLAFQPLFV